MVPSDELPVSKTDVLIIGAGPSGLMTAQALAKFGVKTRVIDRRVKGSIYGNADGLQPRTLEVFQSYGIEILQETLNRSAFLNALVIWKTGPDGIERQPPAVNVFLQTPYPHEATCSVRTIEGVLARSASRHGLDVDYELQPLEGSLSGDEGLLSDPQAYVIQVTLETPEGANKEVVKEVVHAKYVVGAEGSISWVRKNLVQVPMEGEKTKFTWGVIEGVFATDFPDFRMKAIIQSPSGSVIFIPREDGISRIYVQFFEEEVVRLHDGRVDLSSDGRKKLELKFVEKISRILKPYTINTENISWSTFFSVAQMVAAKYSKHNRVFISGDACHTHSPNAGQGANASMADGHNLAWKLAHVLRGWSSLDLLGTYEAERRPYAQGLIEFDKYLAQMMNKGDASEYAKMAVQQVLNTSGIGLTYSSSLITPGSSGTTFTPGTRLPPWPITRLADWQAMDLQNLAPSDGTWKLIVFTKPDSKELTAISECLDQYLPWYKERLLISVVLDAEAGPEGVQWNTVPNQLKQWERVFSGHQAPQIKFYRYAHSLSVFEEYRIGSAGVVLLVRPDGYISIIKEAGSEAIQEVAKFLQEL